MFKGNIWPVGAKDYHKAADRAARIVRDWLIAGYATNDFDCRDYLGDCESINIKFKGDDNDD